MGSCPKQNIVASGSSNQRCLTGSCWPVTPLRRSAHWRMRLQLSMLRDTYAVRYLQAGGDSRALQDLLGLEDVASVKRYQHLSDQLREGQKRRGHPADQQTMQSPRDAQRV